MESVAQHICRTVLSSDNSAKLISFFGISPHLGLGSPAHYCFTLCTLRTRENFPFVIMSPLSASTAILPSTLRLTGSPNLSWRSAVYLLLVARLVSYKFLAAIHQLLYSTPNPFVSLFFYAFAFCRAKQPSWHLLAPKNWYYYDALSPNVIELVMC